MAISQQDVTKASKLRRADSQRTTPTSPLSPPLSGTGHAQQQGTRSRPRLPLFGAGPVAGGQPQPEDDGSTATTTVDDLHRTLDTMATTDYVRKYSRGGARSADDELHPATMTTSAATSAATSATDDATVTARGATHPRLSRTDAIGRGVNGLHSTDTGQC